MTLMCILYGPKNQIETWSQPNSAVHVPTPSSGTYSSASNTGAPHTISGIASPEILTISAARQYIAAGASGNLVAVKNGIDVATLNLALANDSKTFSVSNGDTLAFRIEAAQSVPNYSYWAYATTITINSNINLSGGGLNIAFTADVSADIN